jgi:hypothetical protein
MIAAAIERVTLNVANPLNKYVDPYRNDAIRINSTVFVETPEVTLIKLTTNGPVGGETDAPARSLEQFRKHYQLKCTANLYHCE